ncbi:hypothetical protein GYMLUDRAFT_265491 [Collybiopsis luxurians FD-317 M1]|uniref:DUF6533 domain-containing protein n=1 Tax=Collybiopsis luxurians FD-317 M1 TaxID=944289 RepID=A0A0D0APR5_9AGAR|nr:hypothetical protein GYMLUDRAFT_265491 [Collybiopsis luxurians FD-317 M1]
MKSFSSRYPSTSESCGRLRNMEEQIHSSQTQDCSMVIPIFSASSAEVSRAGSEESKPGDRNLTGPRNQLGVYCPDVIYIKKCQKSNLLIWWRCTSDEIYSPLLLPLTSSAVFNMLSITQFESIQLANIMFSSALGFLYYDHLLTLDAEVRLIWTRPKNMSRYLFFINRYLSFFGNIVSAVSLFSTSLSVSRCRSFELFHEIFLTFTQGLVTSLLTLRVYALYGCNKIFLSVVLGLIVLGVIASVCISILNRNSPSESTTSFHQGCHVLLSRDGAAKTAVAWEGILGVDTVLFLATLWKAYHNRLRPDVASLGVSLFAIVVRDGSIYFLIITSLNLANIISFYVSIPSFSIPSSPSLPSSNIVLLLSTQIPGRIQGNLSSFVSCFSVTLMSRMMLDLHEAADGGIYTNYRDDNNLMFNSTSSSAAAAQPSGLEAAWVNRAYTH